MSAAHDLRTELRRLAARTGPNVTLEQFCREVGISRGTVTRFWGTWTQLRVAAGLPPRASSRRIARDVRLLRCRRRVRQVRTGVTLLLWGLLIAHGSPVFERTDPQPTTNDQLASAADPPESPRTVARRSGDRRLRFRGLLDARLAPLDTRRCHSPRTDRMLRDHDFTDYRGRRVTVMGLGSFGGGSGAVRFLADRGAVVTVTDQRMESQLIESRAQLADVPVTRWRLGGHDEVDFDQADLVVVNPAVKREHPLLQRCRDRGVPLTSEMNLFWQHLRGQVLAVTGSNGKSTTTAMLHNIVRQTGRRCWLGGNLGKSLLPVVDDISPDDLVVLELSSFQLADLDRLQARPHVAVVTNFAPNHLDWHGTVDEYRRAKQTLLRWQTADDVAVLNADDPDVRDWPTCAQKRFFSTDDASVPLSEWLTLPGRHNRANAHAATVAALSVGATLEHVRVGLQTYEALPHRLQLVAEAAGRRFYNDSLATTPESTLVALEAFAEPIVLLAGGYDKQVDLAAMATGIATRTKAVALMGQTAAMLHRLIEQAPQRTTLCSAPLPDFVTAFDWAIAHSSPGDVVVLSPGCASYDWFRNFADRGDQFTRLARAWTSPQR